MTKTFVLSFDEAPKSINHGGLGARGHWGAAHKDKRRWEGVWGMLLLQRKVPRGMMACTCEGVIEFRHAHRRDAENYRPTLIKPFADVLVKAGYIPDDTAQYFEFGRLILSAGLEHPHPAVKGRTTIKIEAEYADA